MEKVHSITDCCDKRLAEDPEAVIRATFTHFYASWALAQWGYNSISRTYGPTLEDAKSTVTLLDQTGAGSIIELTERYFSSRELHNQTRNLVLPGALDQAADKLKSHLGQLDPMLGGYLHDLLFIVDRETGHLKTDILIRAYEGENPPPYHEILLPVEINSKTLFTVKSNLGPLLESNHGLYTGGGWIESRTPPVQGEGAKTVRCQNIAGDSNCQGYVSTMPLLYKTENPYPNTIFFMDEPLQISACILAYFPFERLPDNQLKKRLDVLRSEFGSDPVERAGSYQKCREKWILWHELGHLSSDHLLASMIDEDPGLEDFCKDDIVFEMYADAYAVLKLEEEKDELLNHFCIVYEASAFLKPGLNSSWITRKTRFNLNYKDLFILKTLLRGESSSHVYDHLQVMKSIFLKGGRRYFRKWLKVTVRELKREVLSEITS
jgi:hypothetical protein